MSIGHCRRFRAGSILYSLPGLRNDGRLGLSPCHGHLRIPDSAINALDPEDL